MHKKFFALLLVVLLALSSLVACREDVSKPGTSAPTTTEATLVPGLNTTPDSFVGFDDPTNGTESATQPTRESQETTEPATQPTVSQPTTPPSTTAPTEAVTEPSDVDPQLVADAGEYVAYMNLDAQAQYEKFKTFSSIEEFNAWFLRIEAAYKTLCTNPDYDGGGLVLPE